MTDTLRTSVTDWQETARQFAENADYWRDRAEKCEAASSPAPAGLDIHQAWADYTIRFSQESALRASETTIRDAFEAGFNAASSPVPADHALHFDPDCEECVYLARPTVIHALAPAGLDELRAALEAELKKERQKPMLMRSSGYESGIEFALRSATRPAEEGPGGLDALPGGREAWIGDDAEEGPITDANGDELEHGEPDYPGQDA